VARFGREAAIATAIPVAVFVAALAGTYLYERRESDGRAFRLAISLQAESRFPSASIVEVGIDGSSPRRLTSAPDGVASVFDFQPDWSDEARLLVFARETYTSDGTGSAPKVYAQHANMEPKRLTDGLDVDRSPALSPDGRRIAFARDTNGAFEIFLIDADGTNLRQLTTDNSRSEEFPAWSPDGSRIAYTSTAGENGDLRIMNADGSGIADLSTGPPDDEAPAWSPDGARLVFVRNGNLTVIGADGSTPRPLTSGSERYADPSWSPDGSRIAFSDEERGRLFVIRPDGTDLRQVPVDTTVVSGVAWRAA
jgi:TolB protein